ncbi:hypothetical protein [Pseudoroseomonas sp. WGS1072]|uniref:hypothetical protein n=1 Tax=Roseomonas sp. WGS1072 TaxID=3366816 RepID=UPI003BF3CC6A
MSRRALAPAFTLALMAPILAAALAAPAAAQRRPAGADPSFTVVNDTDRPVEHLFANPPVIRDWGHDRLAEPVPPGGRRLIRLDPAGGCRQDVRVVYVGGAVQDLRGLDTCARHLVRLGGADAAARRAPYLFLRNEERRPVSQVFVSPSGQPDWGMNRLTVSPLPPGAQFRLALPPGECGYDVKVVFFDGMPMERRGLDLCTRPDLRLP